MEPKKTNQVKGKAKGRIRVVAAALLVAVAVLLLGFWLQDSYTGAAHSKDLHALRAHTWAHYISLLFAKEPDTAQLQGRLNALVERMRADDPAIKEIQVLKGTKFLFHTDPAKSNKEVNPEDADDKKTYDDGTQVKFRLKKKEIAEKYLLSIDKEQDQLVLVEPILKGRRTAGVLKIKYAYDPSVSTGFWKLLLVGLLVFGLCLLVFSRLQRFEWVLSLMAVLVLAVVCLFISGGNADSLKDQLVTLKLQSLETALNRVQVEDPGHLENYVKGLKGGKVKGFLAEWKDAQLVTASGDASSEEVSVVPAGSTTALSLTVDPAHRVAFKKAFNRRTRIVTIAFLVIAYLVLLFVLAGYAYRGMTAVKKHYYSYIYIFPAMVGMIVLVFFPFVWAMAMGFFRISHTAWEFAFLDNFIEILSNFKPLTPGNFYFTLLVTVMWTVVNVALHVGIGLILALVLNRPNMRFKKVYRVLLILPWAIPNYITALIWKGMFHKQFGAVNAFLNVLGVESVSWFNNFWTAFFANVATNTWLGFPFMMVIALGALQSIPGDLYEAAQVDGASNWQQFRNITLPLLKPALFPAIILGTIWTFNMFNIIYLVSNGAPNRSTDILITQAYRYAFENFNWGYAAAYSIIIFAILLAYGTFSNKATRATEGAFD